MTDSNGKPKVSLGIIPNVLAITVLAGGWVYNYAVTQEKLREDEKRIATIEASYVPRVEHDLILDRLNRIEIKVDALFQTDEDFIKTQKDLRNEWSNYRSHPSGHKQ